jgi:2-polyprenyl-6-methoxyphenol hydroxylase-like FAD-dependent oxidoreductase
MNDVVIAGAGPHGLMLAGELGLAGIRPVVLEPLSGPNPQRRANGITGQAVRSRCASAGRTTALLVRPDGYVAWASSAIKPEVDQLGGVLQKWFGVASR